MTGDSEAGGNGDQEAREVRIYVRETSVHGQRKMDIILETDGKKRKMVVSIGSLTRRRAEFTAAVRALNTLSDRPHTDVRLFTDSVMVVNVLNGIWCATKNCDLAVLALEYVGQCRSFSAQWTGDNVGRQDQSGDVPAPEKQAA